MYRSLGLVVGCPFWKMKPSTIGLPCMESWFGSKSLFGYSFYKKKPIATELRRVVVQLTSSYSIVCLVVRFGK